MPNFTLELWRVLDITEDIGLNDYPLFDNNYREALNQKIVEHFFNREIGQETIERFRYAMKRKMNEIMPLYNKLYLTEQIEFDPLSTVDLTTINNGESTSNTVAEGQTATETVNGSGSRAVQSVTPQMMLSGDEDYATSAADTTSNATGSGSSNENSENTVTASDENTSRMTGYQGVASQLLLAYRQSLLNIDMMVIEEIEQGNLFMLVWNTGDEYSTRKGWSRF